MNILFRYTGVPLDDSMRYFTGHSAKWCWWCIYDCLVELGHDVTPVNWNDTEFEPDGTYDAIFSIQHLDGLNGAKHNGTKQIVRLTAADRYHHNNMVKRRYAAVNGRRNADLQIRRLLPKRKTLTEDDHILLNGNEQTLATYPKQVRDKIMTMNTCASNVGEVEMRNHIPEERAFLFHAGSGAIHKGLDLVLEAFARHPELTLHVTGNYRAETDFLEEFAPELSLPNIHYHGWVVVSSPLFQDILKECYAFILPSCSEGQSPAVATCLTLGLYPIISRYTGIDLPEGCGKYLEGLTVEDVENAIMNMPNDDELLRQVEIMQSDALVRYSRETFRKTMTGYLKEWLG